jgi:hypothetical protein
VLRSPAWERMKAQRIWAALAEGNCDHTKAIAPVTKGAAALVPPKVSGKPSLPRLVICSPGATPADRMAEIGLIQGRTAQIACGDRDCPGMGGDESGADGALIAGRGDDEHAPPRGMIERLPQRAFPFGGRWHEGKA